jgi:hypothetical protein
MLFDEFSSAAVKNGSQLAPDPGFGEKRLGGSYFYSQG